MGTTLNDTDGAAETATHDALATVADDVLVARAVDGDTDAFAILVRRHAPFLRAYVARIVGSLTEADDVVQESLVTAWRRLPTLRDRSAARAWLVRIATHRAFAAVKRRPAHDPLSDDIGASVVGDPERSALRSARLDAVSHALDKLPEDQRRCWLLRELGDLSYQDVAREMDISPAQVRGRLARARASMTVHLEGWR